MAVLRLAAALALAVAAAVAPGAARSYAARALHCDVRSAHAVVSGRQRCLHEGQSCRVRLEATYRRYVFHCAAGSLVFWWRGLLRRPIRIPTIPPGSACPASTPHGTVPANGVTAFGPGPAYPTLATSDGRAELPYLVGWGYDGWDGGTKALWTVPAYYGPYVVRGRQLDGPNELRFDQGPVWTHRLNRELRLVGPWEDLNPAATFLRGPGCYAYQVDGRGFSYVIVFSAVPIA